MNMPSPKQERTQSIEAVFAYFEDRDVKMIDPILWKTKMMYPMLKEATAREYASVVLRMLEAKRFVAAKQEEVKENGEVQPYP